jgi:hypothetical protein
MLCEEGGGGMGEHRYLLLCRHARHSDGELVAVKGDDEEWRFPTESVARALVEEVLFGDDRLCLATVLYAPTPEAKATTALLLRRLGGEPGIAEANGAGGQPAVPQLAVPFWKRWRNGGGSTGEDPTAAEKKPPQPVLPPQPVTVVPPSWSKDEWDKRPKDCTCDGQINHQPAEQLLPGRLDRREAPKKPVNQPEAPKKPVNRREAARTLVEEKIEELDKDGRALLVVGHQPQLGWLSAQFIRRKLGWTTRAVPVASSEIVCLRLKKTRWKKRWRGQLAWTLAPDDREALKEVADKVKGKMESAKLLSAVITLVLTALLGVLLDANRWNALKGTKVNPVGASLGGWSYNGQDAARITFVMLLAALALYLLTMYSYDRLLMPTRFWAEGRSERASWMDVFRPLRWPARTAWLPRRPPSSAAWVVFRNMQRIWFCLFTPANFLVALALAVLASALLRVRVRGWGWMVVAAVLVIVSGWWLWFRPVLGSED